MAGGTALRIAASLPTSSKEQLVFKVKSLLKKLRTSTSSLSLLLRSEELSQLLAEHPFCADVAVQEGAVKLLSQALRRKCPDAAFKSKVNECLALMGYTRTLPCEGIRILSIDGGGVRGMMALELLEALETMSGGRRIAQLFDYVTGVSTGAIIAALVTVLNLNIKECKEIYRQISAKLFERNMVWGTTGLLLSHAYYDTALWISVLRQAIGEIRLSDMAGDVNCPKIGIVSAIVNQPRMESFLFRNYNLPTNRKSVFPGTCDAKLWQAIQASAAAPGYFEEVHLGSFVHQDGGVLVNNPTGLGIHESMLLWPGASIQCVVSLGNGRSPVLPLRSPRTLASSSLRDKIGKMIESATDTEKVHILCSDLLPRSTYFRLNPYMSHPYTLDEKNPLLLGQMLTDAQLYIRKNTQKLELAMEQLMRPKSIYRRVTDRFKQFV